MTHRREFLKQLSTGSLAAFATPMLGSADPLPAHADVNDETYWEMVKRQFAVPDNLIMMNAANLCPPPYVVNERVTEYSTALSRDVSFQFRERFTKLRRKSIGMLAGFVGADPEEIGITRNTSEANCIIVQGLDFKSGDEIVIWEQNHPSNEAVWLNRAKRFGFTVKKVSVPPNPTSDTELLEPFVKAITSKTRLIAFSHISNVSGIALPAKAICQLAKSKGILTLVDGAQALGFMELNLHDLGCSFYTASTHKWLMGPYENGVLYVNKDFVSRIWPNIIGGGWKEAPTVDENLCVTGQRNEATPAALPDIVNFHHSIGRKNIEDRVVKLNAHLKEHLPHALPGVQFITPLAAGLSGGIVIVKIPDKDPGMIIQKLYADYGIAAAPAGGIRFSPHIYNTLADIDRVVKALSLVAA